jgi:DNA processing protein
VQGRRAAHFGALPGFFCGRGVPWVAVMSTPLDFVALSLLPMTWWGDAVNALRAGEPPAAVLTRLIAERPRQDPLDPGGLRRRAAAGLARAAVERVEPVTWDHPDYPVALTTIHDPPPVLWARGQVRVLHGPAVAIVGSRAGSPYAIEVARELAADLGRRGVVVVSGLARGVDSAAHAGALMAAAPTVGVLGSGVDVIYPPEHRLLAHDIVVNGAIVSELLPGTAPQAFFFPRRNRIISGLVRAVVVIEAGRKSGSLITARCALEQGRDVLAVPGTVLGERNRGGHALLRDGAKIVESADDIVEELGLGVAAPALGSKASKGAAASTDDPILRALPPGEPADLDQISERTGLLPPRLLPRLFELELLGSVRRVGGGRFVRFDRPC